MKNSDIALIILVASISMVISYFVSNAILGDPNEKVEVISYIKEIDTGIEDPSIEDFNAYMINPTVDVYIGNCPAGEIFNAEKKICVKSDSDTTDEKDDDDDTSDDDSTEKQKRG